jgi:hypothetical protein
MKIDDRIISIPPHISTTWENVSSLRVTRDVFVISLIDDSHVEIPDLDNAVIEQAFQAHIDYVEKNEEIHTLATTQEEFQHHQQAPHLPNIFNNENVIGFPLRFGAGGGLDAMGAAMQHNPSQKDMPDLPEEVLNKVSSIAKVLGNDENITLPKAEPHCNCVYCQIARAIGNPSEVEEEILLDEEVSEEDLRFREWDIDQNNDKLFTVSSPLDPEEKYSVYLGNPVGCTCGEKNCPHIKAVLKS